MSECFDDFSSTLLRTILPWGIELTPAQLDQLRTHYAMMIETNRVMNLTRITDPVEAAIKHYADSLALVACAMERSLSIHAVLDIGTGAGFPAIPLAVVRPDWFITAIDATRKKIDFVRRAGKAIGLTNLRCEHANSTHWKTNKKFDLVTLRAVANPVDVAQEFVANEGHIVYYRGKAHESDASKQILDKQAAATETYAYSLSLGAETLRRRLMLLGSKAKTKRHFQRP